MLSVDQQETLRDKVCELLRTEGVKVESDRLRSVLLGKGCSEAPSGRTPFALARRSRGRPRLVRARGAGSFGR